MTLNFQEIEQDLSLFAIEKFSIEQLDSTVEFIQLMSKSHHSTRSSLQNACHRILELRPSYQVNLEATDNTLLDFVDSAIATLNHVRDERFRLLAMQVVS